MKRTVFSPLGQARKIVKSVVTDWLCEACLAGDAEFVRAPYTGPGNTSAALQRVREDRVIDKG